MDGCDAFSIRGPLPLTNSPLLPLRSSSISCYDRWMAGNTKRQRLKT